MHYVFYKVHTRDIFAIKFIIDAYENMMALSTIDQNTGKVQITIAPDLLTDAERILADLETRFFMQRLNEDPTRSQGQY